jgi:alkylhydroperoxidase family enzyme
MIGRPLLEPRTGLPGLGRRPEEFIRLCFLELLVLYNLEHKSTTIASGKRSVVRASPWRREMSVQGRIAPAQPPFTPEIQSTLERIMPDGVAPLVLFTTLARNPRVFQRFMAGGLLDKGSISLREREIMIDRTTARCGSEYEWGVHVAFFSERAELTPDQIRATGKGAADDPVWSRRERLIVRLADALHETATIDDGLWSELREEFSDEQLLELIVLAGFYHTASFLTNALRLPLESHAARFR